ncbi:MAG: hypothetical protein WCO63_11485 [Bacteroidota bacterium]
MFSIIADFQQSGLTRIAFCEQKNIAVAKFYYWQNKLREHTSDTPNGFIRLTPGKGQRSTDYLTPIVMQYPIGVSLQLPAGTPIATLRTF